MRRGDEGSGSRGESPSIDYLVSIPRGKQGALSLYLHTARLPSHRFHRSVESASYSMACKGPVHFRHEPFYFFLFPFHSVILHRR